VVEAKQRIQLQKTNTQHLLILSHTNTSPAPLLTAPLIQKRKTMSPNSNFTYSQSSNGSQGSDLGSRSSITGRQLRSSTRGHDTAPASQQTLGDSHATSPNTQDTIHLSQDRTTARSTQSGTSGQNPADVDINVVL